MSNIVKISKAKKKSKSHIGFLGLLLVISIACFFLLSPIFAIEEIKVEGNNTVTEKYIVTSSNILYGENILKMNKFEAIDKINKIPIIESTKIKREWPNKIVIMVTEKSPIAEVKFYGSKLLISENGDVLNVITDNTETDLPVLEGITVKDVTVGKEIICIEDEKLKKYLEVLKKLKENDMLIDVVKVSDREGILISFEIGHAVFLGDIDNLQYKMNWLKSILEKEENPAYIDLHNLEKVITKPVWGIFDDEIEEKEAVNTSEGFENDQIRGGVNEE